MLTFVCQSVFPLIGPAEVYRINVRLEYGLHGAQARVGAMRHCAEDPGYLNAISRAHL